ncbi:MAG: cytochrome c3 family protein [Desulfobacterales bacterium]|nr:cytochrome c3 family protein [Desulfobacterales bacterium]
MQSFTKKMILFVLLIVLATGIAMGAAEGKNGAKEMVLFGGSLGDVPFPHHRHQAAFKDCNNCHNLFPQTVGAIQELNRQDKLKKKEVMNQCTKCHKELASTDKKGGPVKCKECHQKK